MDITVPFIQRGNWGAESKVTWPGLWQQEIAKLASNPGILACVPCSSQICMQSHPLSSHSQEPERSRVGISRPLTDWKTKALGPKSPRARTTIWLLWPLRVISPPTHMNGWSFVTPIENLIIIIGAKPLERNQHRFWLHRHLLWESLSGTHLTGHTWN